MSADKEKVTGIGGVFFRVRDPVKMAAWYREHLGICSENGFAEFVWTEPGPASAPGRTIWSVFPSDTEYFGPTKPGFMINYRVPNLERMLAQLWDAGIQVDKVEDSEFGRFAWITDPEGNRIELWQPPGK